MTSLTSSKIKGLQGSTSLVPADKSISHRALLLASQAAGRSTIHHLLEGEDVLHTTQALRALGVGIAKEGDSWIVDGVGTGGLCAASQTLDMGNSGTGVRLLMGLVGSHPFATRFTGDSSLQKRPMNRVIAPLERMGVDIEASEGGRLPLTVKGNDALVPIRYELPVASAQVKSAILLAALNIPGKTTVVEKEPTRDHTERMLKHFGANITVDGHEITLEGYPELTPQDITIPSDPSSAAFPVVAALITPDSHITIGQVGINPLRTGLYDTLKEMGAEVVFTNEQNIGGEPVADIEVRFSQLKGIEVPAERAPSMIDEYPILCIAAAMAEGRTVMHGVKELRVKESDRIAAMEEGLKACGVEVSSTEDTLTVEGRGAIKGGATIKTHMDHRIAMAFYVLGMVSDEPVTIDDDRMIDTSFPGFVKLMKGLEKS